MMLVKRALVLRNYMVSFCRSFVRLLHALPRFVRIIAAITLPAFVNTHCEATLLQYENSAYSNGNHASDLDRP